MMRFSTILLTVFGVQACISQELAFADFEHFPPERVSSPYQFGFSKEQRLTRPMQRAAQISSSHSLKATVNYLKRSYSLVKRGVSPNISSLHSIHSEAMSEASALINSPLIQRVNQFFSSFESLLSKHIRSGAPGRFTAKIIHPRKYYSQRGGNSRKVLTPSNSFTQF